MDTTLPNTQHRTVEVGVCDAGSDACMLLVRHLLDAKEVDAALVDVPATRHHDGLHVSKRQAAAPPRAKCSRTAVRTCSCDEAGSTCRAGTWRSSCFPSSRCGCTPHAAARAKTWGGVRTATCRGQQMRRGRRHRCWRRRWLERRRRLHHCRTRRLVLAASGAHQPGLARHPAAASRRYATPVAAEAGALALTALNRLPRVRHHRLWPLHTAMRTSRQPQPERQRPRRRPWLHCLSWNEGATGR